MQRLVACLTFLALAAAAPGCTDSSRGHGASASAAAPVTSAGAASPAGPVGPPVVVVQLGADLPPRVASRVEELLRGSAVRPLVLLAPGDAVAPVPSGSLVLGFGETSVSRQLIPASDLPGLGSEGYALRSRTRDGVTYAAADGNPPLPDHFHVGLDTGTVYGAYALLEALGFAFLHPLEPTLPPALGDPGPLAAREAPRWPERGWHIHTMHPLELTDLLNGWGPGGPQDEAGWRAQLPEWERFCEWAMANRQNHVEWVLLMADSWQAFADGPARQARLRELVDRAHAWGLGVGIDAAIALKQQHAWRMVRRTGTLADEVAQIEAAVDYLAGAGFDFIGTELGTSEFTNPGDQRMLDWLNAFTDYSERAHGKPTLTKIHISRGQYAQSYVDPDTGAPLNFNFLPHYADPRLGVMPHTVQHYALDDPAPTYGNQDFAFMREFLQEEAGARKTIYYPETCYWVSFDVDVPLFLPVYADRRLYDLRLIAQDEDAGRVGRGAHAGSRIDGQIVFSSGWEWGYWLQEVVAARAAWNPLHTAPSQEAALAEALEPVVRPFGPVAQDVRDVLLRCVRAQNDLLIHGRVNGVGPASVEKRNGQAYLQGWETWDDVSYLARRIPGLAPATTQPDKLGLVDMRSPRWLHGGPDYATEVQPLLAEMAATFEVVAADLERLVPGAPAHSRGLLAELADAARMTALRARQVHGLYDYVHGDMQGNDAWARARLAEARQALDDAAPVVARREAAYRVDADRIAGWRQNPTAYEYGYLWTARSLHYWWRDEGKAVDRPWSPAYLNTIDPLEVAFGEGLWTPLTPLARQVGQHYGWSSITDLLDAPRQEPRYPPAGLRSRP